MTETTWVDYLYEGLLYLLVAAIAIAGVDNALTARRQLTATEAAGESLQSAADTLKNIEKAIP